MSSCVGLVTMIIRPSFVVHGRRVFDVGVFAYLDVHLLPGLNNDLGLSLSDRKENIRRIAAVVPRYSQIKM